MASCKSPDPGCKPTESVSPPPKCRGPWPAAPPPEGRHALGERCGQGLQVDTGGRERDEADGGGAGLDLGQGEAPAAAEEGAQRPGGEGSSSLATTSVNLAASPATSVSAATAA
ncbi:hypothetical protein VUR80DRAFT_1900 [Thermomyces stellatus]